MPDMERHRNNDFGDTDGFRDGKFGMSGSTGLWITGVRRL